MGEVFAGRYELVDPIGHGGVGAVWRAWDQRRRRYVAAKVLQQRDAHALLRFVREQALRIDHPHVLAPASWAADDDKVLFTMDLVAGGSLVHLVNDYGPLPPPFVCTLLDQLLAGVAAVHAEGVVHRDIKPANVLLEATGTARPRLRLSDFGIAMRLGEPRLTETNYVVGTPGYFAPEQMMGAEPDFPADLFAVGLVALYLLEGAKPDAKALIEYFAENGTPSAPRGIPEPLWQVVAMLLQPDPHARFRTATGARKALASAAELLPEPGPDDELVEVFDQLGPLPEGFGPHGPLRAVPGVNADGLPSGPPPRGAAAPRLGLDSTPRWPGSGSGFGSGVGSDAGSGAAFGSGVDSGSNSGSDSGSTGSNSRTAFDLAPGSGSGSGSGSSSSPGPGAGSGAGPVFDSGAVPGSDSDSGRDAAARSKSVPVADISSASERHPASDSDYGPGVGAEPGVGFESESVTGPGTRLEPGSVPDSASAGVGASAEPWQASSGPLYQEADSGGARAGSSTGGIQPESRTGHVGPDPDSSHVRPEAGASPVQPESVPGNVRPQSALGDVPPPPQPTPQGAVPPQLSTMSDTGSFHLPPPQPAVPDGQPPAQPRSQPQPHPQPQRQSPLHPQPEQVWHETQQQPIPHQPRHPPEQPPTPSTAVALPAPTPLHTPTPTPTQVPSPHRSAAPSAAMQQHAYASTGSYTARSPQVPPQTGAIPERRARRARPRPGPPAKVAVPVLLIALACFAVGFWALAQI
ncbi:MULTISPECIES: serine/threonine-protein kinase [Streptomyces]|uniref:non-specific serine/threonine protein kinase n=1 Tax=Streptomyces dengpaensis TaxID=2049881 RepID=A0ABN5IDS2_9ACTN|nr:MULTISPECIES: serine/threonine-protein kinase [Streptomyces]AVH61308.1 serine/threonine protein kinase [Streptomyces dengpaensis]